MRKGYFQFKQFGVRHEKSAMKVSTDAVVLGALAGHESSYATIFEVGLGTGVISLMLAQRFPQSKITGVEIDQDAFEEASHNALESPFASRLLFLHTSFQEYLVNSCGGIVDLLISNPPYFPDHLKSSDYKRNLALHTDALNFDELLKGAAFLLKEEGEFWVILPERQMQEFIKKSSVFGLKLFSYFVLKDTIEKPVLRLVCGFSKKERVFVQKELIIKTPTGEFSAQYSNLLKEFLLIF